MAISARLYIFEEGGAIKRVSPRIQDALVFGNSRRGRMGDQSMKAALHS